MSILEELKRKEFYVLSPHLDDAVLSMGMLLYRLRQYRKARVVNIFTKAHGGPYTLSARQFLKAANYDDGVKLYKDRLNDDVKALSILHAETIDLSLSDALFRIKSNHSFIEKYIPEFLHIYPTYRWHVLKKIQPSDYAPDALKKLLKKIIPKDAIVFAPFGVGNHADHVITGTVGKQLFENLVYYVDFPYNIRLNDYGTTPDGYIAHELKIDLKIKSELAHYYSSQIYGLFPGGVMPDHKEIFYVPEQLLK